MFHLRHAAGGQIAPGMLSEDLFEGLGVLHLMGSTLSIHEDALQTGRRALELAQAHGAKFSFDPNLRPQLMPVERAREVFAPFVAAADVIMPTAEEACLLTGSATLDEAVPALLADGLTLVVSPLISLMQDQVATLRRRGIPAAFLNSTLSAADQRTIPSASAVSML